MDHDRGPRIRRQHVSLFPPFIFSLLIAVQVSIPPNHRPGSGGFYHPWSRSPCSIRKTARAGFDIQSIDVSNSYVIWLFTGHFTDPGQGVTNNVITSQVASGLVKGLFPQSAGIEVIIQSSAVDSLEPTYPCNKANQLKTAVTTGSQTWNDHLTKAADLYAQLDAISGTAAMDTAGWHVSFDQLVLFC